MSTPVTEKHRRLAIHAEYGPPQKGGDAHAHVPRWVWQWMFSGKIEASDPMTEDGLPRVARMFADLEAEAEDRGRAAERADVIAWMRDRDTVGEHNAEDIFTAAYQSTRKGMGLAESVYRGMAALSEAVERGEQVGSAERAKETV